MAKDAKGHGSDSRGGSVPDQHQLNVARKTVKMPAAMAAVMGGMTPAQAHALIAARGSLADKAMAAEYAKIPDSSSLASGPKSVPVEIHPAHEQPNAWGQYPKQAAQARAQLRSDRKQQLNKPPSQRRSYP
jgi:hypothetical protein